jgi:hypothetical protein
VPEVSIIKPPAESILCCLFLRNGQTCSSRTSRAGGLPLGIASIYDKIKANYDSKEKGKFLAIDIDSEEVYLGNTSTDALEFAKQAHPNKVFYVVKIGFDVAETVAKTFLKSI